MKLYEFNTLLIIVNLSYSRQLYFDPTTLIQIHSEKTKSQALNNISAKTTNQPIYSIDLKPNKHLDSNSVKKNTKYVRCVSRTGSLYFVIKHPKKGETKVKATPVFASLNKHTFSLFKEVNNDLIESIKLDSIERITRYYKGSFCFNLMVNKISNSELNIKPTSMCAATKEEMNNWINSILEFKHCKLKKINELPGKIMVDFNKVNKVTTNQHLVPLNNLYYNNTNQTSLLAQYEREESKKINNTVSSLLNCIKKGKIAHKRVKRKFEQKLKEAKRFTDNILKKREKIKEILKKKVVLQKNKERRLINIQRHSEEMKILKEASDKIKKLNQLKIERSKAEYNQRIKEEKAKSKSITRKMIRTIMQQDKKQDFSKCISHELYSK